jgi:hypothetical protein
MPSKKLLSAFFFAALSAACGARVEGSHDGGTHAEDSGVTHETTKDGAVVVDAHEKPPADAGTDCGQPSVATYSCGDASADASRCSPYGEEAGTNAETYPLGCTVTLPTCDFAFGGAQTCNCQVFPGGGPAPTWICPM